ncbi:MAG: RNA-directed DNA polymerase [Bryobacteraceae bacterium]|nr:RNA-directed DNA polymerase [Bryobacteraceae bacterium]
MSFTIEDLGLAYRKAKVDLYYSSNASLLAIADYESRLYVNLTDLLVKLNGIDETWVESPALVDGWTYGTKSISLPSEVTGKEAGSSGLIFSSPADKWNHACTLTGVDASKKPTAEFRVMANCSLDFHVLSALWILKVGHLYDSKLKKCAYGNRLRRTKDRKDINPYSMGSFAPYLRPFKNWRDRGIDAMRVALAAGKKVVALTADVRSFYHELNPGFMLDAAFLQDVLSLDLTEAQQKLNRLFIRALESWSMNTPLKKGLPVGLPASAVVANMALIELDRLVEQQIVPLYYGRYVDDILLVMENGADFQSASQLWEWVFARSGGKLNWVDGEEKKRICFQPDYLKEGKSASHIIFANAKTKVFLLAGETGQALVDSIARQVHESASEWRGMPQLPHSASHIGTDLLAATQTDGEAVDNLRKADALTMRRAAFAIKLRDFEAYERDLTPDAWKDHRHTFFRAFTQHVLVLPDFFELANYLPRVIQLATACEDYHDLRKIIDSLKLLCAKVRNDCTVSIKAWPEAEPPPESSGILARWEKQLFRAIYESIMASFPPRLSRSGKRAWQEHIAGPGLAISGELPASWPSSAKEFKAAQERLFSFDLAHMPFRFIGLPAEMVTQRGIPARKTVTFFSEAEQIVPEPVCQGISLLARWIGLKKIPHGLLFATRPFNLPELYVIGKEPTSESGQADMASVVMALRGFRLNDKMPLVDQHGILRIPDGALRPRYIIAVSSWKTHIDSWTASVTRLPDPDTGRYARMNRLLDGVIKDPHATNYLILPELALPAHWFIRIARKLQGRGISLISGIAYLHGGKRRVRNQVWAALSHNGLGFPSYMIHRQDKQRPALHEEQELQRLAGLKLEPAKKWKTPPIIQHGEFLFALLVCSELTNIEYRAALRGQVDALFVPEWNPDTETFNVLVESTALDVHAYVIQCNDREYGDSRIRAPYKDLWKRDVLRVKGGISDYCVIGEIDIHALRQFQSSHRSPAKPFKPVPDGFKISHARRVLPADETA